jgi:TolC family type I secretion outer membrane protein
MDVVRDTVDLEINRANVRTLDETLKQTRERYAVGEVTATDVSQAETQLAAAQTALRSAEAQLTASKASYRQVIGLPPINLSPASPVDRLLPRGLQEAVERGLAENPNVTAATYGVDVAYLQIKINEGALFPTLAVQGSAMQDNNPPFGIVMHRQASLFGQLTIPIFQGGAEYSLIRQSKESLTQQRLSLDLIRTQVRQQIVQSWGQLEAAKAQVQSAQSQVTTAEAALRGVREEARVGQRTTIDVLNAEQAVVNARIALAAALHDRVVTSYAVLSGIGRLSAQGLALGTPIYDPTAHYQQVRDAWFGLRTPEGDPNFPLSSSDVKAAHRVAANETMAKEAAADISASSQLTLASANVDAKVVKPTALAGAVAAEPLPTARKTTSDAVSSRAGTSRRPQTAAAATRTPRGTQAAPASGMASSASRSGLMPGAQPALAANGFRRSTPAQNDRTHARQDSSSTTGNTKLMAGAQPIVPASNFGSAVR